MGFPEHKQTRCRDCTPGRANGRSIFTRATSWDITWKGHFGKYKIRGNVKPAKHAAIFHRKQVSSDICKILTCLCTWNRRPSLELSTLCESQDRSIGHFVRALKNVTITMTWCIFEYTEIYRTIYTFELTTVNVIFDRILGWQEAKSLVDFKKTYMHIYLCITSWNFHIFLRVKLSQWRLARPIWSIISTLIPRSHFPCIATRKVLFLSRSPYFFPSLRVWSCGYSENFRQLR